MSQGINMSKSKSPITFLSKVMTTFKVFADIHNFFLPRVMYKFNFIMKNNHCDDEYDDDDKCNDDTRVI